MTKKVKIFSKRIRSSTFQTITQFKEFSVDKTGWGTFPKVYEVYGKGKNRWYRIREGWLQLDETDRKFVRYYDGEPDAALKTKHHQYYDQKELPPGSYAYVMAKHLKSNEQRAGLAKAHKLRDRYWGPYKVLRWVNVRHRAYMGPLTRLLQTSRRSILEGYYYRHHYPICTRPSISMVIQGKAQMGWSLIDFTCVMLCGALMPHWIHDLKSTYCFCAHIVQPRAAFGCF